MKWWTCLAVLLLFGAAHGDDALDPRVKKLRAAEAKSKDKVIRVKTSQFEDFASGKSRPYSLVVFFTSEKMQKENPNVRLDELRKNFGLMTTHCKTKFKGQPAGDRVFFLEVELKDSGEVFHRLEVHSLPWVVHIGPSNAMKSNGMISIGQDDRMKQEDYPSTYPWLPNNFADFLKSRAGVDCGKVHVPTLFNNPLFILLVGFSLLPLAWQAFKIYQSPWFGHPLIWGTAVLAVYWFAVSGGMYNIIRGTPFTSMGQDGKPVWYTNQGQLGAEGFVVGSLYLLFALSSSSLVFAPSWFGNGAVNRVVLYVAVTVAALAAVKIVDFFTWKTGYRLRIYVREGLVPRW